MSSKKKQLRVMESEIYEGGDYEVAVGRSTEHQLIITVRHKMLELACLVFWADDDDKVNLGIRNKGDKLVLK